MTHTIKVDPVELKDQLMRTEQRSDAQMARPLKVDPAELKGQLMRAERRNLLRSYSLILPLFIFILLSFLIPLGMVFYNSVSDPLVAENLPKTVASMQNWDAKSAQYP